MRYQDRAHAGEALARLVEPMREAGLTPDPIVLALPRGGVPVAEPVARALRAPLDVILAHKIGLPGEPELGVGAIAADGQPWYDRRALAMLGVDERDLDAEVARERARLRRADELYRHGRPPPELTGRAVVIVDDGLATGATARAALRLARRSGPKTLTLAVPVGAADTVAALRAEADELVCAHVPERFHAVGLWYERFDQVTDDEVVAILRAAAERSAR